MPNGEENHEIEIVAAKEEAADAKEAVAHIAAATAEIVTDEANAAIERAEIREAQADAVIEAVVDAAIEDEKTQRVIDLEERILKCQMEMTETKTMMESRFSELTERLEAMTPPPMIIQEASTPAISRPLPTTEESAVVGVPVKTEPLTEAEAAEIIEKPVARVKQRLRLL